MLKSISISRHYAPLRVCADICFYFYAVSLFSFSVKYFTYNEGEVLGVVSNLIAPWSAQLSVLVAACFVLGFVIVRIDNTALRFLLSLLPGLSFLMSPLQPILLIHAAAWVYYVVVMAIGSFEVHLDVYRRRAGIMLFAALMLTLCLIIFHFGTIDWYYSRLFGGEVYGLLFFVFCVLSLRGMRTETGAPKMMRALDAAYVVALPALLLSAFFLLRGMVPVITYLFKLLTRFLLWLYHVFFPTKYVPAPLPSEDDGNLDLLNEDDTLLLPVGEDLSPDDSMLEGQNVHYQISDETAFWLMIAFLAIILIFIAINLIRKRQKRPAKPRVVHEKVEKPVFEGLLRRSYRDADDPANVRQIRKIYRSYLKYIRSRHIPLSASDTSEDVLSHSTVVVDVPENERLRELYIAARYGEAEAVTAAQAGEARRCLDAIQSGK